MVIAGGMGRLLSWGGVLLGGLLGCRMIWRAYAAFGERLDTPASGGMADSAHAASQGAIGLAGIALVLVCLGAIFRRPRRMGAALVRVLGVLLVMIGVISVLFFTMIRPCVSAPEPPRVEIVKGVASDQAPPRTEGAGCLGGAAIDVLGTGQFLVQIGMCAVGLALGLKLLILRRGWRSNLAASGLAALAFELGIWFGLMPHSTGLASVVVLSAAGLSFLILTLADRIRPRPRPASA